MTEESAQHKSFMDSLAVEFDREVDGRWIAEIPKLAGVMAYGETKREALKKVCVIAETII
jgi:predicted RNase H-like HicB family nuclease